MNPKPGENRVSLAAFDFDGTLTTKDSMIEFMRFHSGDVKFFLSLLYMIPVMLFWKLGFTNRQRAKEILMTLHFGKVNESEMISSGEKFAAKLLPTMFRQEALEKLAWHQTKGHDVVVVTASLSYWIKGWCKEKGIQLVCTKAEILSGNLTGKIEGYNCHGPEKVSRMRASLNMEQYDYIYAYGDTSGDKEMIALADEGFFRKFN